MQNFLVRSVFQVIVNGNVSQALRIRHQDTIPLVRPSRSECAEVRCQVADSRSSRCAIKVCDSASLKPPRRTCPQHLRRVLRVPSTRLPALEPRPMVHPTLNPATHVRRRSIPIDRDLRGWMSASTGSHRRQGASVASRRCPESQMWVQSYFEVRGGETGRTWMVGFTLREGGLHNMNSWLGYDILADITWLKKQTPCIVSTSMYRDFLMLWCSQKFTSYSHRHPIVYYRPDFRL